MLPGSAPACPKAVSGADGRLAWVAAKVQAVPPVSWEGGSGCLAAQAGRCTRACHCRYPSRCRRRFTVLVLLPLRPKHQKISPGSSRPRAASSAARTAGGRCGGEEGEQSVRRRGSVYVFEHRSLACERPTPQPALSPSLQRLPPAIMPQTLPLTLPPGYDWLDGDDWEAVVAGENPRATKSTPTKKKKKT